MGTQHPHKENPWPAHRPGVLRTCPRGDRYQYPTDHAAHDRAGPRVAVASCAGCPARRCTWCTPHRWTGTPHRRVPTLQDLLKLPEPSDGLPPLQRLKPSVGYFESPPARPCGARAQAAGEMHKHVRGGELITDDRNTSDQHIPAPGGCRWCGLDAREHAQQWKPPVGWHKWEPPTLEQRKDRMLARRRRHRGESDGHAAMACPPGARVSLCHTPGRSGQPCRGRRFRRRPLRPRVPG